MSAGSGPRLLAHNSKLVTHNLAGERSEYRILVTARITDHGIVTFRQQLVRTEANAAALGGDPILLREANGPDRWPRSASTVARRREPRFRYMALPPVAPAHESRWPGKHEDHAGDKASCLLRLCVSVVA
jgi:hypothetical protein